MTSYSEKIYSVSPVWLQNILVSFYGIGLWQKRYSGDFKKILNQTKSLHYQEKSAIDEIILARLKKILNYCNENIPHYKQLFSKYKIDINSFNSIKNLEIIPILDKETLREKFNYFLPRYYKKIKFVVQNTSGSTGTPLSLFVDKYTYQLAMALLVEHEELHGIKMGDRKATFAGRMVQEVDNNKPPFWRFNIAENQMLFSAYHLSKDNMPFYIEKLNSFKPKEIIGYPSAIYTVAKYCEQENLKLKFTPKAIITNSETLFEWQRETIEEVFKCKIYDYYCSAEYVVFAGQCSQLNYHINPLLGILEVVNSEGVNIINEMGEIVCTTLSNYAMPLIRYRIGDIGILSDEQCQCGCNFTILKSVEGRVDDIIITKDGKRIGRLDHIFKGINFIKECQIIQLSLNKFKLKLIKDDRFSKLDEDALILNLKKRVSDDIDISIEYVSNIERTSRGKFKGVISYCNQ